MTSLRILPPPAGDNARCCRRGDWPRACRSRTPASSCSRCGQKAIEASEGTTDFGQYFFYFSFFLVVAALLLTGLFFRVGVEQRLREIGLLEAIGLPPSGVRGLFLREGAVLAAIGSLAGVAGAIGYASLIMLGLRTWWVGAVGTTALRLQPDALTLAVGAIAGFVTALGVILLMLRQAGRAPVPALLKGALEAGDAPPRPGRRAARPPRARVAAAWGRAALFTLIAAALLLASAAGAMPEAGAFFGAGACAMAAGLFALSGWLRRPSSTPAPGPAWRRPARPRRHRRSRASRPQRAGLRADCLRDLRRRRGRRVPARRCRLAGRPRLRHRRLHPDGGVGGAADVRSGHRRRPLAVRARLARCGADARRRRPSICSACARATTAAASTCIVPTTRASRRRRRPSWRAAAASPSPRRWPMRPTPSAPTRGGCSIAASTTARCAAIVDATSLQYVFHAALGDDLVVPGTAGEPVRLRVVATLSHSVFQSEILIGDAAFVRLYPQHEGHRLWMIDGDPCAQRRARPRPRGSPDRRRARRHRSGRAAAQLPGGREHLPVDVPGAGRARAGAGHAGARRRGDPQHPRAAARDGAALRGRLRSFQPAPPRRRRGRPDHRRRGRARRGGRADRGAAGGGATGRRAAGRPSLPASWSAVAASGLLATLIATAVAARLPLLESLKAE